MKDDNEYTDQQLMPHTRAIFDAIADAIAIHDRDFRVTYQNQSHKDLMGSHEGEYCYQAFQKKDGICKGCHVETTFRTGGIVKRTRSFSHEDGPRYLEITSSPLRDSSGNIIAAVELVRDMTERKKTEDALRESEERYRDLFENASDLIQIVGPDGHFLFVNRAWKETFGYRDDEIAVLSIFDVIAEDCGTHCSETFQRVLAEGIAPHIETEFLAKDGRRVIVEGSASCKYEEGKPVSTRCMFRDVTIKRKMEQELYKNQQLESLGIFAGGIAHDFNNILTAILGNISLSLLDLAPGDRIYENLQAAEQACFRAKELSRQLLTFSRGGEPVKKVLSLGTIIRDAANFTRSGSAIQSTFIIPDDLWPVEADEGQIAQVINNLVINAMEAMPEGGTVTIHAENMVVDRNTGLPLPTGKHVKITVTDNGVGISPEHLQKIFDPFFTTKPEGSGLGLAVTFSIVRKHKGYITAESEPGVGTAFHVYLPASEKPIAEGGKPDQITIFGKGRVLVMDDEEMVRNVSSSMLNHLGYDVSVSGDGMEAITLYRKARECGQPFDVVIMDLTIPGGMGGREAIENLLVIDPGVKAIVSSGYSNDTVIANYRKYGFCGCLEKPFRAAVLGELLHRVIHTES